jgi:hypothetical protein
MFGMKISARVFCVTLFMCDPDGYLASQCRNSRSWCRRQRTIYRMPGLSLQSSGMLETVSAIYLPCELMHLLTNSISFPCPLCTGNFHALLLFKGDEEQTQVTEAARRLARRAIALDGTCKYLDSQQSPSQIPPKKFPHKQTPPRHLTKYHRQAPENTALALGKKNS